MSSFLDRYTAAAVSKRSVLCMGLDPTKDHLPPQFDTGNLIEDLRSYLYALLRIAAERVPVVKPQSAYYEAMGTEGMALLCWLEEAAHELGLLLILDAKRSDIGETMAAYAKANWISGADACTFNPYLGSTFIPGWLEWAARGRCAISMVLTSNPEADQLQLQPLKSGLLVYEHMAQLTSGWNNEVLERTDGNGCIGAVVGATWPAQAVRCRELLGDHVFTLIPGYGAQGGGAEGAVVAVPNSQGQIVGVVNSSRGLTRDSWLNKTTGQPKPGDPLEHIIAAVDAANAELNAALEVQLGRDPYATS